jgi:hypothetical protein
LNQQQLGALSVQKILLDLFLGQASQPDWSFRNLSRGVLSKLLWIRLV